MTHKHPGRRIAIAIGALGIMLGAILASPPSVVAAGETICGAACDVRDDCNSGCGCPRGGMGICVPGEVE